MRALPQGYRYIINLPFNFGNIYNIHLYELSYFGMESCVTP